MTDLLIEDNKIILSDSVIKALNASPGDRIAIEYAEKDSTVFPIIIKSEGGNKLSKTNTVSFRGVANKTLSSYGTSFEAIAENGIIYLYGDGKYRIFTDVKEAVKHIDKSIIENDNFNINLNSFVL